MGSGEQRNKAIILFFSLYLHSPIIAVQWYSEVGGIGVESERSVEETVRGGWQELHRERVIPLGVRRENERARQRRNLTDKIHMMSKLSESCTAMDSQCEEQILVILSPIFMQPSSYCETLVSIITGHFLLFLKQSTDNMYVMAKHN